jgi:hypothetical protein
MGIVFAQQMRLAGTQQIFSFAENGRCATQPLDELADVGLAEQQAQKIMGGDIIFVGRLALPDAVGFFRHAVPRWIAGSLPERQRLGPNAQGTTSACNSSMTMSAFVFLFGIDTTMSLPQECALAALIREVW